MNALNASLAMAVLLAPIGLTSSRAQDRPLLEVEISIRGISRQTSTFKDRDNVIRKHDEIVVDATITNVSGKEQIAVEVCDNGRSWKSDNESVTVFPMAVLQCEQVPKRIPVGKTIHEKVRLDIATNTAYPLKFRLRYEPARFSGVFQESTFKKGYVVWSNAATLSHP